MKTSGLKVHIPANQVAEVAVRKMIKCKKAKIIKNSKKPAPTCPEIATHSGTKTGVLVA